MKKFKKPKNVESLLLTKDENLKIFELLGYGCESKCTAIVQLFQTEHPYHDQWINQHTGVLCLVKDYNLKMYFFRLYCFNSCTILWEYKIPPGFLYVLSAKFLHTFIGQDCAYGFSFTDEIEASSFFQSVQEIIQKIKMPKRTGTLRKTKNQDTIRKSVRKNHKPVISNPVEFKHVQHFGFNDWRELDSEILKLSRRNENASNGDDFYEGIPPHIEIEVSTNKIKEEFVKLNGKNENVSNGDDFYESIPPHIEVEVSSNKIKEEFERKVSFQDEIEPNYVSTPKPVEQPQFNFMDELNSKIGNKQMITEEEKFPNVNQFNYETSELDEHLKQTLFNRQRGIYNDDSSDSDSDNWD